MLESRFSSSVSYNGGYEKFYSPIPPFSREGLVISIRVCCTAFYGSFPLSLNLNNSPEEVKCLTKGLRAMLSPEVITSDSLKTIRGTKVKILDTVLYNCIPSDITSSHALYRVLILSSKSLFQVAKCRSVMVNYLKYYSFGCDNTQL